MGKKISSADKEVLAEIVRLIQRKGLKGFQGGWNDFLQCHDKKFGSSMCDPAKRSRDFLIAFIQTFTKKEQKVFSKIIRRNSAHIAMKQLMNDFPDLESPQQRLVRLTMEHPQYMKNYFFQLYDEDWKEIHLGEVSKALLSDSRTLMAIDCEMVLCQDGSEALVKICAVDHNLEVKLDRLVNPNKAVADYRTHITGISSKDLEGVTCSLADIQKSLKKLLSDGAILVGHSLHNDLRVLKLDHPRVIDTSYIFKFDEFPFRSPSLDRLCKVVLGCPVRKDGEPHNCLNDAQAAMKLVLAKLEHGYDDPIAVANNDILKNNYGKLLLHKIPLGVPTQELQILFSEKYNTIIETDMRIRGETYTTHAVFQSSAEADEAFSKIDGNKTKDSNGLPQKHVLMKLSSGKTISFYVRRMTPDVHFNKSDTSDRQVQHENADLKRLQGEDDIIDTKRQRTCLHSCDHVREIKILKEALRKREEEIFNLQKTLFDITREQNL